MRHWVEHGVLILEMAGLLPSAESTLDQLRTILDGLRDGGPYPLLFDVQKVQGTPSRDDQERVLALLSRYPAVVGADRAIVVESLVQYGLARLGMVLHEHRGVRLAVFRDRQKALLHLRRAVSSGEDDPLEP